MYNEAFQKGARDYWTQSGQTESPFPLRPVPEDSRPPAPEGQERSYKELLKAEGWKLLNGGLMRNINEGIWADAPEGTFIATTAFTDKETGDTWVLYNTGFDIPKLPKSPDCGTIGAVYQVDGRSDKNPAFHRLVQLEDITQRPEIAEHIQDAEPQWVHPLDEKRIQEGIHAFGGLGRADTLASKKEYGPLAFAKTIASNPPPPVPEVDINNPASYPPLPRRPEQPSDSPSKLTPPQ